MMKRTAGRNFYDRLLDRAGDNGRRAVDVYTSEIPEIRALAADVRHRTAMVDFAVWLRCRAADLSSANAPFSEDDLERITAVGGEHSATGMSRASHRRIITMHTGLMLREIHELATFEDINQVMHLLNWSATHGYEARNSYIRGFLEVRKQVQTVRQRVRTLAALLLGDNTGAAALAKSLNMAVAERYVVLVVRLPSPDLPTTDPIAEKVVDTLYKRWFVPASWHEPGELVALLSVNRTEPAVADAAQQRALGLARDIARELDRPCSVGTATGHTGALTEAFALARNLARTAPAEVTPGRLHTMADLFVELGVARLPEVDRWLQDLAQRLTGGPNLLITLDTYYQHDMNRLRTANALCVHPRTLDYRLERVHQLVGIAPHTTRGVRILTATVTRALARRHDGASPQHVGG